MASLLSHGAARRLGVSMIKRTQAAVAEERRRFVTRRLYTTQDQRARQAYLQEKFGHLKPHQVYWMLMKVLPLGKFFGLVAGTTGVVMFAYATRQLKQKEEAAKKREQSASTELKPKEAEKKREQEAAAMAMDEGSREILKQIQFLVAAVEKQDKQFDVAEKTLDSIASDINSWRPRLEARVDDLHQAVTTLQQHASLKGSSSTPAAAIHGDPAAAQGRREGGRTGARPPPTIRSSLAKD